MIGHSNAMIYTNLDILMCRLNTNGTLDWDITYDFFINSQDFTYNLQVGTTNMGTDQIVTCGKVLNNITSLDVALTSYSETGAINWQALFDDNSGGDHAIGFERSYLNNFFLCSYNSVTSKTSITEFYPDGTTNFSYKANWTFNPLRFKIDSAENSFAAGSLFNTSDFNLGIYLRTGVEISNTPAVLTGFQTTPASIATDNTNIYVAGSISDYSGGTDGQHSYVQKFDLAGNLLWSTKIMGFDSAAMISEVFKATYDAASGALYVVGADNEKGSTVTGLVLTKINPNGTIAWIRTENLSDTRAEYFLDLKVANGFIYITGISFMVTSPSDYMAIAEKWDVNGNKQWEYVFDKVNTKEEGRSVAVDNVGNVFVGGKVNESTALQTYSSDILLLKLNSAGGLVWKEEYNGIGNGSEECANIELSKNFASNPRIYMSANTQSTQGYYFDIGTLKYCDLGAASVVSSGSNSICQGTSMTLASTVPGAGSVLWSNGTSGAATSINTTGNYYFTYSESDGCAENSDTLSVNIKGAPAPVQICMVTVDDSSKHNLIIWDKTTATPDVIGFNIYREDLTNIYTKIASVPYANLSQYTDLDGNANPNTTTKRYKITAVDSCGNESQMSNYHNTIYIVSNGGGQFSWNQLYSIENSANPVAQYILLRDDFNTNNWQAIDSTAGTQFNINDVNFPTFQPTANWRVVTQWNISCTATAKQNGSNTVQAAIVKSKSNITNNRVVGIGSLNENSVKVYPNPAQNTLNLSIASTSKITVKIMNLLGDQVYTNALSGGAQQIDISNLSAGTYLL